MESKDSYSNKIDYKTEEIMALKHLLEQYKDVALSDTDVMKIIDGKANMIRYPEMHKIDSIEQLLSPYGACVILYETKPHFGHWCCITVRDPHTEGYSRKGKLILEFWDSYGKPIDSQLSNIPRDYAKSSNQDLPYLSYLLLKESCPYKLSYNQYPFQKLLPGVSTCGRWVSLRILLKDAPLELFKDLFYGMYSDEIAAMVTHDKEQLK